MNMIAWNQPRIMKKRKRERRRKGGREKGKEVKREGREGEKKGAGLNNSEKIVQALSGDGKKL